MLGSGLQSVQADAASPVHIDICWEVSVGGHAQGQVWSAHSFGGD